MSKLVLYSILNSAFAFFICNEINGQDSNPYVYKPIDLELHNTITHLDSVFFDAYNHCETKLDIYSAFYEEDLEFFHDKGGLSTSKADVVAGTKKNICGKVSRELLENSIEVYPIQGYGAIALGQHRFINHEENDSKSHFSKFIVFWHQMDGNWKISKVVSLH